MEYAYPVGNGVETQSLGTLLRSQSSQNSGGTQGGIQDPEYQNQNGCEPHQSGVVNGVGALLDMYG
jgi:hypothetical protein